MSFMLGDPRRNLKSLGRPASQAIVARTAWFSRVHERTLQSLSLDYIKTLSLKRIATKDDVHAA